MTSHTVLVVEDNPANLKLATLLLERAGYDVIGATNATDGIALARQRGPALILMDIQLPGMDGLSAVRLLRQDEATRDIRIIALTAFAMKGDDARMLAAGCDGYVAKPIRYREFLAEIERILR